MPDTKIIVGLCNPKSATNVGAVMRAAGCFFVDSVIYTGQRYDRAVKLNTDTKKISSTIPLSAVNDLLDHKSKTMKVICVDLIEGASPLPHFKHPENALYIFGPEDGTIDQTIIDQADAVVYVPTIGCMNLAATVNVVLYDRLAKSTVHITDNELIRRSRDTNNNVKVRC
ncbi:RNA methyltransferase [Psychromonas antarctica]|jgi:tRNA(Leu) C34 or U34 (ribose-2'-O)-methylase TrmL|uniref:RNA methyltransferase n=1 Tax=Psychromonas antarctica TaxID=67573 RepID=UPI001EE99005|nr:RNA methyltransferase [Psychromonas antarctica]MCG6201606.1 RNA methyltransferase [Psychromonas antarctica]